MNEMLEKTQEVHKNLVQPSWEERSRWSIRRGSLDGQTGGRPGSIETGMLQLKLLKEKPNHLAGSIKLYKSLRDLSVNFNAYNDMSLLSAYVGDLALRLSYGLIRYSINFTSCRLLVQEIGIWIRNFQRQKRSPFPRTRNLDARPARACKVRPSGWCRPAGPWSRPRAGRQRGTI
jgi:hypothetical protein